MANTVQKDCKQESDAMGLPSEPHSQRQPEAQHAGQTTIEGPKQSDSSSLIGGAGSASAESKEVVSETQRNEKMAEDNTLIEKLAENGTGSYGETSRSTDSPFGTPTHQQNKKEDTAFHAGESPLFPDASSTDENVAPVTPTAKKKGRPRKNPVPQKMPTLSEEGTENGEAQTPQPPKVYKKRGRKSKAELLAMRLEQGLPETPEPVPKQLEEEVIDEKEMTLGGRPKRRAAKAAMKYLQSFAEEMGYSDQTPQAPENTTAHEDTESSMPVKRGRGRRKKRNTDEDSDDVTSDADFVLPDGVTVDEDDEDDEDALNVESESDLEDKGNKIRVASAATKPKFLGMAANGLLNNVMGPVWNCMHMTKEYREQYYSPWVFPEWIPSVKDWKFLSESEALNYLPQEEKSPPFRIRREGLRDDNTLRRIGRFQSLSSHYERWDLAFFVGGPVWSMEWCPCPEGSTSTQYAAIYSNKGMDDRHKMSGTHIEPALLQIWNIGDLQHFSCPTNKATFAYGVALDYGCIWNMKWCPSGTWELPSSNRKIPQMPRLGLLAASFSNGKIAVFSLPHPESLTAYKTYQSKGSASQQPLICKVQCTVVLEVGSVQASSNSQCGQCFCLDWIPMEDHKFLAAGFYDGTVALWNLTTKSLLQRVRQTNESVTLYPYHSFIAHDHAVRVVTWCKASSDFILTASEDRKLKFWDLRRTYEPVNVIKRYLSTEVSWQLHWCGISVAQENCYVTFGLNGIHYIDAGYIGYKPYFVAPRRGTVWSISGSDWLNTCTTGDSTGEVIMMLLADMTANPNNIKRSSDRRFPVYRTELVHFDAAASRPSDAEGSTETTDRTPVCEPRTYSEAIKKFYLLFEDTDMRSFKNAAMREPMKQMCATESKGSLSPDRMPLDSIHKVRFNPNLDAHGWLLSGGQSGIVRAHCLRGLNSPIASKLIRESQAQFNTMYQPQGTTANEAIMKTVIHSIETIVEVL
ncbi:general transcription factor 3C polypeptide 2-like [Acipenser ruthenus]|uniref:general transcription factor 3C polypeptide 2-like n=1 Tax=Acipenser ruthenus TaxID=7906 RepID=UPI002740360F|nr:general transcription factor 3C polypeptide 2-like [Acipenser ruthenus]XP_033859285.3 general transcription factor 3C polypeptide 2-like [Acipenser ruthenus]XP_058879655.1 general transcription factor 3C polypeptide 2-like [Acipenser ruthenus]